MKKYLMRRDYEMVYGGSRGWLIRVELQPASYWMRDKFRDLVLDVLGHPCCSPPNGSEFWMQFDLPGWVHTGLFYFDNWPLKRFYLVNQVAEIPLTSEQAYKIDPEFYDRIQRELAEEEAEDALDV